jgi:lipopolysaccharide biosynthesis protein
LIRPCSQLLEQQGWSCVRLFGVPNRGRDIAPFVRHLLPACAAGGHPWFVKVHTKRSSHLHQGQAWAEHLHSSLLHPEALASLAAWFEQDPQLGLVAPAGALQPLSANLSANGTHLQTLLAGFDLDPRQVLEQRFAAGSMAAMRTAALDPLIERIPPLEAFESEAGQTDGTLAHALERLLGLVVQHQGYKLVELSGSSARVPELAWEWAAPLPRALCASRHLEQSQCAI